MIVATQIFVTREAVQMHVDYLNVSFSDSNQEGSDAFHVARSFVLLALLQKVFHHLLLVILGGNEQGSRPFCLLLYFPFTKFLHDVNITSSRKGFN